MPGTRRRRAALGVLALLVLVTPACDGDGAGSLVDPGSGPTVEVPPTVRATVGEASVTPVVVRGGDAPAVAEGLPPGATLAGDELSFRPEDAGRWTARLRAGDGPATTVTFEARHPARPGTLVALGDSVASGQGLELSDWLGRDPCWRAREESYAGLVFEEWRRGRDDAQLALVACSGATVGDLLTEDVTGGPAGAAPPGTEVLAQVEWAVRANPALVTVTVGANDLQFSNPARSFTAAGELTDEVDGRLQRVEDGLTEVLRRLVDATDARVVVTTYHDPTAAHPQGVPACEGECFARAAADVVDRLAAAVEGAADRFPAARVQVADVRARFEGHGAPNGIGIDAVRAGGLGPLGDLAGRLLGGVSAFCARGDGDGDAWVNAVDCVHPNAAGARAYADEVLAAIGRFPAR